MVWALQKLYWSCEVQLDELLTTKCGFPTKAMYFLWGSYPAMTGKHLLSPVSSLLS